MRSDCEKLREQALNEGLNGKAALAWRVHCRTCPDCRTELYVLETLQRQAVRERQDYHLSRREVAALLETAREYSRHRSPLALAWTWSLRLACAVFAVLMAAQFFSGSPDAAAPHRSSFVVQAPAEATLAAPTAATPRSPPVPAARAVPLSRILPWPEALPIGTVEWRLQTLRRQVSVRREALLELMDRDLGERRRQNVWDDRPSGLFSRV